MFVVRRVISATEDEAASLIRGKAVEEHPHIDAAVKALIRDQVKRAWEELSSGRLKVEGETAGADLAKTFAALHRLRPGEFLSL